MFQVASHPTPFDSHKSHPSYHRRESAPSVTKLPRSLERPAPANISSECLAAASPECADVPVDYIKTMLLKQSKSMMSAMSTLAPHVPTSSPKARLPPSVSVPLSTPLSSSSPPYPTHILAVHANGASSDAPTAIFPIHALVIASHCQKFPPLPPSNNSQGASKIKLAVLPLALPSPNAFPILHTYMYNHRLDAFLGSLLPFPKNFLQGLDHEGVRHTLASGSKLHQLSTYILTASSNNVQTLMTHVGHIRELWSDMIALGVQDPDAWDALDLAYEVILGSLNLAAQQ